MKRETAIEIITGLLRSGNSAELTATGWSMFPTLRHGDKVLVKPLVNNSLPLAGSIIVVNLDNNLILHRLTEIRKGFSGTTQVITRGDCMADDDDPCQSGQILGVAYSFVRNGRVRIIKCRIPGGYEYSINRMLLWAWVKIKKFGRWRLKSGERRA